MDLHRLEQRKREMKGTASNVRAIFRARKNGIRNQVILFHPDGVDMQLKPAHEEETDDPNGYTVNKLKKNKSKNFLLYSSRRPAQSLDKFADLLKSSIQESSTPSPSRHLPKEEQTDPEEQQNQSPISVRNQFSSFQVNPIK